MSGLASLLSSIDHGTLSDLVGDAKIVELVNEVSKSRNANIDRGDLILQIIGGPQAIFDNPQKRRIFFLSLSGQVRKELEGALKTESLDTLKLTEDRRKILFSYFKSEIPQSVDESAFELLRVQSLDPNYALFQHQNNALQGCKDFLLSGNPRVMLHMPTGSGKTRTAMHLICNFLNSRRAGVVVWLVAGKELCTQASEEYERAWKNLGSRKIPLVRLWSDACEPETFENGLQAFNKDKWPIDLTDGMIIGSVDSVRNLAMSWEASERIARRKHICLVVFDEAHRSVAKTYSETIQHVTDRATAVLGLSATPGRRHFGGQSSEDNDLVSMFGGQKVILEIPGYTSPVKALIEMGYLADLKKEQLQVANSTLTSDQLRELQRSLATSLDIPEHLVRIFGLSATRNLQISNRVEQLVKDQGHKRVIVFAPSVESSVVIANVLKTRGVRAESVTNKTPTYIRNSCVSDFKAVNDTPFVLTNFGVLTTGFDAPHTSAVVVGRPTTSIVLLNQMAGRAIRGPLVKGNKESLLITVVDTQVPELVETIKQFHAFDESWNTTKGNT